MSTLYEIDRAIMNCCNQETGEMIDKEALDALMMQRTEKLESVALWIKNLQSDAIAFKKCGNNSPSFMWGMNCHFTVCS